MGLGMEWNNFNLQLLNSCLFCVNVVLVYSIQFHFRNLCTFGFISLYRHSVHIYFGMPTSIVNHCCIFDVLKVFFLGIILSFSAWQSYFCYKNRQCLKVLQKQYMDFLSVLGKLATLTFIQKINCFSKTGALCSF